VLEYYRAMEQQEEGKDPRWSGRGWRLMFFFLLHGTCARRRGNGLVFRVKLFFHY
jgi:hypothetical protein